MTPKKYEFYNESFYSLIQHTEKIKQSELSKRGIKYREKGRVYLVLYWKNGPGFGEKTFKSPMGIAIDKNHVHTETDDLYAASAIVDYSTKFDDEFSVQILHGPEHIHNHKHPEQYNRLLSIVDMYHNYTTNFDKAREIETYYVEYALYDHYDINHCGTIHAILSDEKTKYYPSKIMYSNKYFKNRHSNAEYNRIRAARPPRRKNSIWRNLINTIKGPET